MKTFNKIYFAKDSTENIGERIFEKIETYYEYARNTGLLELFQNSYDTYYQNKFSDGKLFVTGPQGEYLHISVNHYGNICKHLKRMTVQQRPAFQCTAANSDAKSAKQTYLANDLLDYFMREKGLSEYVGRAVEYAVLLGEAFIETTWDVNAGETYLANPQTGEEIKEGDLRFKVYGPLDVIRDPFLDEIEQCNWFITRRIVNRFDLAEEHKEDKELFDKIMSVNSANDKQDYNSQLTIRQSDSNFENVYLYTLYHKPTSSVPAGRQVELVDSDCVLVDVPLPYEKALHQIRPDNRLEVPFGYTPAFDLLPIQEMLNGLYSTIATNQKTFGVQNILVDRKANINTEVLARGLRAIKYSGSTHGTPISSLNLTSTPAEIFKFLRDLVHDLETISGVNSVTRGNPEASLKSGAALALVASQAIQFSQDLQQSYTMLLQSVGTAIVNILKEFAKVPRIAKIAGKKNQTLMREFTGDDLKGINRVQVDIGNPLMSTVSGRVQLAETFIQNGMVENIEQYLQVVETGRIEPLTEAKNHELMNIRAENEALLDGSEPVIAVFTDDHALHIKEHAGVLASTEARKDPDLVARVKAHTQEHIHELKTADRNILAVLGQQPIAPTPPPQMPAGAKNIDPSAAPPMDATDPVTQKAKQVNQPNMPNNPLTGQEFNNETGGL